MSASYLGLVLTLTVSGYVEVAAIEPAYLVEIQGELSLRRESWTSYVTPSIGTEVDWGDLLQLPEGAKATVLCPDLRSIWRPPAGETSGALMECPKSSSSVRPRLSALLLAPRGTEVAVEVVRPRGLTTDRLPALQWTIERSVGPFAVEVIDVDDPGRPIWGPALVDGLETRYPDSAAKLRRGHSYRVRVRSAQRGISAEATADFEIILTEDLAAVREGIAAIRRLSLSDQGRILSEAILLSRAGLSQQAVDTLEELEAYRDSASVLLLSAQLRRQLGLGHVAVAEYEASLELASRRRDLGAQAQAHIYLAEAKPQDGRENHLRSALRILEELGDCGRADMLRRMISE